jgi:hypothetical protein
LLENRGRGGGGKYGTACGVNFGESREGIKNIIANGVSGIVSGPIYRHCMKNCRDQCFCLKKHITMEKRCLSISVADPHRKNADADPGKNLNADADADPDPDADAVSCSY